MFSSMSTPKETTTDLELLKEKPIEMSPSLLQQTSLAWQSEADLPIRRKMIAKIASLLSKKAPDAIEDVPDIARRLEDGLYRTATSIADYTEHSTLRTRLQSLAKTMGARVNHDSNSTSCSTAQSMQSPAEMKEAQIQALRVKAASLTRQQIIQQFHDTRAAAEQAHQHAQISAQQASYAVDVAFSSSPTSKALKIHEAQEKRAVAVSAKQKLTQLQTQYQALAQLVSTNQGQLQQQQAADQDQLQTQQMAA